MSAPAWAWWGDAVPYRLAWERQERQREQVIATGEGELLAMLVHRPVVTLGKRRGEVLVPEGLLAAQGVELVQSDRGGLATWHGPGQLVGYLIVDLGRRGMAVRTLVATVEDVLIRWLAGHGVEAEKRCDAVGVWIQNEKIAAVGLHVRRGVTLHGFSLNLCCDLDGFGLIVPCGIEDAGVTSLEALTGARVDPREAAPELAGMLREALTPPPAALHHDR